MVKHYKRTIIYPEKSREWLARFESGEALKTIAQTDHYDIRTVKRQVEEADESRTMKEVRQSVLRTALEKHFNDFVALAERIREMTSAGIPLFLEQDTAPLLNGLRQHLPRAPLWDHLDEYQSMFAKLGIMSSFIGRGQRIPTVSQETCSKIENLLFSRRDLIAVGGSAQSGSVKTPSVKEIFSALWEGLCLDSSEFKEAIFPEEQANADLAKYSKILEKQYLNTIDPTLKRLQRSLIEELTTIILRRVVPGHCDYCPL